MRKDRNAGFTVMELMIVVAIIGILVSIATASMAEFVSSTRLRTAVHLMASRIRQARLLAITTSSACFVKFDVLNNSYTLNGTQNALLPVGIRFGVHPEVTGCPGAPATKPPLDGTTFGNAGNPNTLIYYPTGEVVPAGTVYVTDGKRTFAVRVSSIGRPKLWRANGGKEWTAL